MQQQNTQQLPQKQKNKNNSNLFRILFWVVISFISGFLIVLILIAPRVENLQKNTIKSDYKYENETAASLKSKDTLFVKEKESILVDDQPAGNQIEIKKVFLARGGWVVVYKDNNGAPGKILGAQKFNPGVSKGTIVYLRPATVSQEIYYAIAHKDDGDGKFDYKVDTPSVGERGQSVIAKFKAI